MASKSFQRKLRALEFPIWNKFDIENREHIKSLVVYLEQTKIRELKVSQRANLKKVKDKKWVRYFGDYLDEIEDCPYQLKPKMDQNDWVEIIEWLVSQAIARTYSDGKDDFNRRTPIRRVERREYALTGCEAKECEEAMNGLCKFLNIPANSDKVITSQTLYHFIKTKFSLSSITNYEATLNDDEDDEDDSKRDKNMLRKRYSSQHDPWQNVKTVDDIIKYYGQNGHMANHLGFTTGDKHVDAAAIILRVLYVLDVRQSQNQLNEIVTFLQRFTANPKTNPNLGKVGK
eukprot:CAMPEP_0201575312 /NCGR_PEP_ID=MMETSP0190_2-20130828/20427_1 /ASSEMBLY_ACC=CAM_ASM_000263 /TAXON_ID=37353 /ORGANISM="Rosalina sp." /LENGTH=287 /DNA_ID=CAMNT_0048004765 /DNA_START=82 /DNA_END=945 /DNA_ORIENTATION=-